MTELSILKVRASESGMTLLDFMARRLSVSGKKAKACLDARRVFVNGRRVWMARHKLRTGDEVRAGACSAPARCRFAILFRDNDYLIVNKPPGITTERLEHILAASESMSPPVGAHRLDKDTSGCLIFARRREAKEIIIPLFAAGSIFKMYHALVEGELREKEFSIRRPVDGLSAVTHVRVLDSNKLASHVLTKIETGRTHQIRKHFSALHHPVVGDRVYAGRGRVSDIEMTVPRQMLHAFQIGFEHPFTGGSVFCKALVPRDFQICLKKYGLT